MLDRCAIAQSVPRVCLIFLLQRISPRRVWHMTPKRLVAGGLATLTNGDHKRDIQGPSLRRANTYEDQSTTTWLQHSNDNQQSQCKRSQHPHEYNNPTPRCHPHTSRERRTPEARANGHAMRISQDRAEYAHCHLAPNFPLNGLLYP